VIIIHVPPLRERVEDIPLLVQHFVKQICEVENMPEYEFTDDALAELKKMTWNGNVRELRNVVERMMILCNKLITKEDIEKYSFSYGR
jgi:DNA-binding NtrC family response regulator